MFQDGLEEWIAEAVVLATGETILFFGQQSLKEGLPLGDARDVGFHLGGPVNWARTEAQVKMMVSTVQEGHWAITDAIKEMKTNLTPTASYNIREWMWDLEEDASRAEVRNDEVSNCGIEWKNTHSQHLGRSWRRHRRQGTPWLLRDTSSRLPSSGAGSSDQGSKQSSHQSTMTRGSRESNWAGRTGRGLRVKVNLPILKEKKDKGCCDLSFVVVGCTYPLLLRLGWPTLVAICLLVTTGVPWRPCKEVRRGCYLNWHLADVGQVLWHGDNIHSP